MKKSLITIIIGGMSVVASHAQTLLDVNFASGYTNGNLVGPVNTISNTIGQNGWAQTGNFTAGSPITIATNQAVLLSGATGQDAWKAFSSEVNVTNLTAGQSLMTTINFSVTNAVSATGDYFFHLSSPAGTSSAFFQRLFSRSTAGGFQLGINGASAAGSAAWGSTVLSLNTAYKAVIKWDFLAGATNDILTVYVNPTDPNLTANTVYASTNFIVAEPTTVAAANLRIGSAATTPGVLVDTIDVQLIPEPSSSVLLLLGAVGYIGICAMRRKSS